MDKCVKLIAVVLTVSTHMATGHRYGLTQGIPFNAHDSFHHSFEHYEPVNWHESRSNWDTPKNFKHDPKFHKDFPPRRRNDDQEYWRSHHSSGVHRWGDSDSSSWEYPDFPNHGQGNNWHNQGSWGQPGRPNTWNDNNQGNSNGPNQANPNSWSNQGGTGNNNWPNRPNQGSPSTWGPVTPPSRPTTTTIQPGPATQTPLAISLCIRSCPVTPEYNPVCGSNNVTYGNAGRLECAKYCGVDVTLRRNQPCPPTGGSQNQDNFTQRPNNTNPNKDIEPTRFTTILLPTTTNRPNPVEPNPDPVITISPDILNSIFTPSTTTEKYDFDIDIRTRSREQPFNPV